MTSQFSRPMPASHRSPAGRRPLATVLAAPAVSALLCTATVMASPAGLPVASAQAEFTPTVAPGPEGARESDPAAPSSSIRKIAPNTDNCPQRLTPPEPVTTSERLAPGQVAPTALPPVEGLPCGVTAPPGFQVSPDVVAAAWMVSDIDTGEIIAMKDPHGRYRPASIIKVLLALVALEELDLKKVHVATAQDASIDGSAVGLGEDGRYTVEQLLQGLIMASGNDAAHALAQELGGDEAALRKVNALAAQLGTQSTRAASYSGLDAAGMSTSAADMSLIYRAAFKNPTFARLAATEKVDFPGYRDVPGYELWNDNGLFMNDEHGIGGKTGYTDDAHHTFVGALDRDGRRLQAVILDTTVEHGFRAWQQAQLLLHEAYRLPAGAHVASLADVARPTAAATSTAEASPTPSAGAAAGAASASAGAPQNPSNFTPALDDLPKSTAWVVVALVGLLAVLATFASLLLGRRSGRGRRAGRSRS